MLILEDYQDQAVDQIVTHLAEGVPGGAPVACLLHATTGSGKTLILTRAAAKLVETGVSASFMWTAPYDNIIGQTQRAISEEGGGLIRGRALADRTWGGHRTGDVWVTTASLIANSKAGPAEDSDFQPSLMSLGSEIRKDGRRIYVIIDEAHLNAREGNKFVEACLALAPDGYVAATATPDDKELAKFFRSVGVEEVRTVSVDRHEVISRRLNKGRLDVIFPTVPGAGEQVRVDALISAAWAARNRAKAAYEAAGLKTEPLMLVQAENGGEAKVLHETVKRITGLDDEGAAIYESGSKNKADLTKVAADEKVKALVFKVAAGTGFDAPRACVLASARTVKNETSAAQFVGRIMRVPREVRSFLFANPEHPMAEMMDTAHLFLIHETDKQGGFSVVAEKLRDALIAAGAGHVNIIVAEPNGDERETRQAHPAITRLLDAAREWDDLDHLNEDLDDLGLVAFWPRLEGPPQHFRREVWSEEGASDEELHAALLGAVDVTRETVDARAHVVIGEERAILVRDDVMTDSFEDDQSDHRFNAYLTTGNDSRLSVKWTMERLPGMAEDGARRRFISAVTERIVATGAVPSNDPVLAGRIAAMMVREAFGCMKTAVIGLSGRVRSVDADELPDLIIAQKRAARPNRKSIFRHFTDEWCASDDEDQKLFARAVEAQGMRIGGKVAKATFADGSWTLNDIERSLVREFSSDENSSRVDWWARNPPRKPWSVALVNAGGDGEMFYPDFVVFVNGRIRLFETKHDEKDLREKAARGGNVNADYGEVIFVDRGLNGRLVRVIMIDGKRMETPLSLDEI